MNRSGRRIDRAHHHHRKFAELVLGMDRSVIKTLGQQQGSAADDHVGGSCDPPFICLSKSRPGS
jgi:hypothetical protein